MRTAGLLPQRCAGRGATHPQSPWPPPRLATLATAAPDGATPPRYSIIKHLGSGAFANVQLCRDASTTRIVAIKCFNKSLLRRKRTITRVGGRMAVSTALDKVDTEIAIMKKLRHPNVVRLYEVAVSSSRIRHARAGVGTCRVLVVVRVVHPCGGVGSSSFLLFLLLSAIVRPIWRRRLSAGDGDHGRDRMRHRVVRNLKFFFLDVLSRSEVIDDATEDALYMVIEFCAGGPVMSYDEASRRFAARSTRGAVSEELAVSWLADVLAGLKVM